MDSIYRAVKLALHVGVSQSEAKRQITGSFFRRPLEHILGRLSDSWQTSQPSNLRHMGIIRDAAQAGRTGYYVHYSYKNYAAKVQGGGASWEAVRSSNAREKVESHRESRFMSLHELVFSSSYQESPFLSSPKAIQIDEPLTNHNSTPRPPRIPQYGASAAPEPIRKRNGNSNSSKTARRPRKTPWLTYEEQLHTIHRPGPGVYLGNRVNVRTEGHRGRPRVSRLMIFKGDYLKRLEPKSQLVQRHDGEQSTNKALWLPPTGEEHSDAHTPASSNTTTRIRRPDSSFTSKRKETSMTTNAPREKGQRKQDNDDDGDSLQKLRNERAEVSDPQINDHSVKNSQAINSNRFRKAVVVGDEKILSFPTRRAVSETNILSSCTGSASDSMNCNQGKPTPSEEMSNDHTSYHRLSSTLAKEANSRSLGRTQPQKFLSLSGYNLTVPNATASVEQSAEMALASTTHSLDLAQSMADRSPSAHHLAIEPNACALSDAHTAMGCEVGNCKNQPSPEQQPISKQIAPFGGSVVMARKKIIMDLVKESGGVFPGDRELWYPFATRWMQSSKDTKPDQRTVKQTRKSLLDGGRLRQVMFAFQNRQGVLSTKSILTLPHILPSDERVDFVKSQMIAHHPDVWLPESVEVRADIQPSTVAQKSAKVKMSYQGENATNRRRYKFRPEEITTARGRAPAMTKEDRERSNLFKKGKRLLVGRCDDVAGSGLHFFQPLGIHNDLQVDFEPELDPRIYSHLSSTYMNPGADTADQSERKTPSEPTKHKGMSWGADVSFPRRSPAPQRLGPEDHLSSYQRQHLGRTPSPNAFTTATRQKSLSPSPAFDSGKYLQCYDRSILKDFQVPPWRIFDNGNDADLSSQESPNNTLVTETPAPAPAQDFPSMRLNHMKRKLPPRPQGPARLASLLQTSYTPKEKGPCADLNTFRKRVRLRGPRANANLSVGGDLFVFAAVIVVRVLTGGLDRAINWDLVARALDTDPDRDLLLALWIRARRKFGHLVEKASREFQDHFLQEYSTDRIAALDFNNLQTYDWKILCFEAVTLLQKPRASKATSVLLNRTQLERGRSILLDYEQERSEFFEARFSSSTPKRHVLAHRLPSIRPLSATRRYNEAIPSSSSENQMKSSNANRRVSDSTLLVRELQPVKAGVHRAVSEKARVKNAVQSIPTRNRGIPQRNFELSEGLIPHHNLTVRSSDFLDAGDQKKELDVSINKSGRQRLKAVGKNGQTLSIVELVACRQIRTHRTKDISERFACSEDSYRTSLEDKKDLDFDIELTRVEGMPQGNPLLPLPGIPCRGMLKKGAKMQYPLWVDIHGLELKSTWQLCLCAILNILFLFPASNAKALVQHLGSKLETFEIKILMSWLVDAGAALWADKGHQAICLREWWWMTTE